ncbi:MAG: polysaccharide biosynthesis/export family protein [Rhodospirillales bacterium]|nr:polysaccharide biosynthesis/export family protein [Rhodospirillales bacterium]
MTQTIFSFRKAITALVFSGLCACAPLPKAIPAADLLAPPATPEDVSKAPAYRIGPGDVMDVKFFYSPDLDETVAVRPDGRISLRLVDDVAAAGLTPLELDHDLTARYAKKLPEKPDLSVILRGFENQRIYVTGDIRTPGEYPLKSGLDVMQAITTAGGFLETARPDFVLLIRKTAGGPAKVYRVNMSDPMLDPEKDGGSLALLAPTDVIYVPRSGVAQANLFVDQYIRKLLFLNTINLGVSGIYELNDASKNRN